MHDWSEVRKLDREGLSRQAIARRLQMSRTTVYRLLALEEPPAYERDPSGSLLDPFKGAVLEMLTVAGRRPSPPTPWRSTQRTGSRCDGCRRSSDHVA